MAANQTEWKKLREKIKSKFSKLTDNDLDSLNGHMEKLQDKVQKVYNYSKDQAIQECKAFNRSLKS